jgi:hypothetical protein
MLSILLSPKIDPGQALAVNIRTEEFIFVALLKAQALREEEHHEARHPWHLR